MAWNRPDATQLEAKGRKTKKSGPWIRGVLAAAIVIGGALIGCLIIFDRPENASRSHQDDSQTRQIAEVTPSRPKVPEKTTPDPVEKDEWNGKYPGEKIVSVSTNSSGFLVERTVDRNGRRTRHISTPPSPWKHGTDELIANALSAPVRGEMAPLPPMGPEMDKKFRESLKDPLVDQEGDSEELKALREIVRSARAEILERMENGAHFADILNEHRELHNDNGRIRSNAIHELKSIIAEGDDEGAHKYLVRMNAAFSQMGISQISIEDTQPKWKKSK